MKILLLGAIVISFSFVGISCDSRSEVEKIVDAAIAAHGGEAYQKTAISFDFRGTHYSIFKSPTAFEYRREFTDSTGQVVDVLNNTGFTRKVNGVLIDTLTEERVGAFSRSVNSVAYFAFLPYGLNDAAAIKTYLGQTKIKGKDYHKVKVTFQAEGGGEHFEDEFLYWFGVDDYQMDYMAYLYYTDGGGVRMREVRQVQEAGGIRFQDYINFKPVRKDTPLDSMQFLYERGALEKLSEINLENIRTSPLPEN
ncbi:MAG: DUF6503 family protein [Bacteroidota bacterium]|jgi:hypothetical protein|nr:hypothetical protein [Algoriphagus sp.]